MWAKEAAIIVVFGSINLDMIFGLQTLPDPGNTLLAETYHEEPGGKGANQAYAAARDGARVIMHGAVGDDGGAATAMALLKSGDVDISQVKRGALPTGRAAIWTDAAGRNMIVVAKGANDEVRAADVDDAVLGPGTLVLVQRENDPGETSTLIRRASQRGARVVLNLAPAGWLDDDALRAVDVLIVNGDEAKWLGQRLGTGATATELQQNLGVAVIRTLGGDGVDAALSATEHVDLAAHAVEVVDTTAAGDCFVGVLAAALDRGLSAEQALRRANAAGALACTRRGSQSSAPSGADIDAFLQRVRGK